MEDESDRCANCGHERYYHQGSGGLFNTKGCGVTYCNCKKFIEPGGS